MSRSKYCRGALTPHVTIAACNQLARAYAIDTLKGDLQSGFDGEEVFEPWRRAMLGTPTVRRLSARHARKRRVDFSDRSIDLLHIDGAYSMWI
jgi:hypothetical protein